MRISDWSSDVCSSDLVVRGTITDSDGHFILSPLEQSSAVGNYDVVIAGATTATNIVSDVPVSAQTTTRSEEHTSELQSLLRTPYPVFCLKKETTSASH